MQEARRKMANLEEKSVPIKEYEKIPLCRWHK